MFGVKFKKLSNLKRFGKIVLVMTKKNIQGKISNSGTVVYMFVGYPQNHSDDVYSLFNVEARQVMKSKHLIWLDKDDESWVSKKKYNESGFVILLVMMTLIQQPTFSFPRKRS
jgi:hypothetical protein